MIDRKLIFSLVASSLFIPSIEALESTNDFDSLENENNIGINILIAEGGGEGGSSGGGMSIKERKEKKLKQAIKSYEYFVKEAQEAVNQGESQEELQKIYEKIAKYKRKIEGLDQTVYFEMFLLDDEDEQDDEEIIADELRINYKMLNNNQFNIINKKTYNLMKDIWTRYERIALEYKIRKESEKYNDAKFEMELLGLSPRSLDFTKAALDSKKDGNKARAETYHKLAIKSLKSSLNKNEVDSSEEHHHHGLIGFNYYHIGDFENSNKSLKKAASGYKKPKEKILTKTLIATTAILSGNVNQGCQDLYDYFADDDIVFDSTFPIEDFCIFDEEKL